MSYAIASIATAISLAAGLTQPATVRSNLNVVVQGRIIAQANCSMCHAIDMQSANRNPDAPPFPQLHRRYPMEALDALLTGGMLSRHPAMPKFRFTRAELTDLTAYLDSVQDRRPPERHP